MKMTEAQRARQSLAGRARMNSMTREEARELGQMAYLTGAIKTVHRRAAEISSEDRRRLIAALVAAEDPHSG